MKKFLLQLSSTDKSAFFNLLLKPLSMILAFVYIPLLITYLGQEKYGLWATLLSIISWINYCDIGIGHGLRNILTKELTYKNYESAKKSISTAYIVLFFVSLTFLIIGGLIVFLININDIFKTKIPMQLPVYISLVFVCINFVLSLCNTVLYSLQLSENIPLRNCLTQVLNIIGIKVLSTFSSENLIYISFLFGCTTMITYGFTTISLTQKYKFYKINPCFFEKDKIKEISCIGIKFFLIQIPLIVIYSVDNLLVTNMFGAAVTTTYNIVYSVFNAGASFFAAFITPYWSKTTEALAKGNISWIKSTAIKLNLFAMLFNVGLLLVALLFERITEIWLGNKVFFPNNLIAYMCFYFCLFNIVIANVQIINGTGFLNIQLLCNIIAGIIYVPLARYLAIDYNMGVIGVKAAGIIINIASLIIYPINLYLIIKKIELRKGCSTQND